MQAANMPGTPEKILKPGGKIWRGGVCLFFSARNYFFAGRGRMAGFLWDNGGAGVCRTTIKQGERS